MTAILELSSRQRVALLLAYYYRRDFWNLPRRDLLQVCRVRLEGERSDALDPILRRFPNRITQIESPSGDDLPAKNFVAECGFSALANAGLIWSCMRWASGNT
jgi:hypothetical protein